MRIYVWYFGEFIDWGHGHVMVLANNVKQARAEAHRLVDINLTSSWYDKVRTDVHQHINETKPDKIISDFHWYE